MKTFHFVILTFSSRMRTDTRTCTNRQTDRQTDTQTDRHTDIHTFIYSLSLYLPPSDSYSPVCVSLFDLLSIFFSWKLQIIFKTKLQFQIDFIFNLAITVRRKPTVWIQQLHHTHKTKLHTRITHPQDETPYLYHSPTRRNSTPVSLTHKTKLHSCITHS